MTWNTFRDHLILEYEIPKYDGDMGRPSLFMPLSMDVCEKKVGLIVDTFRTQASKHWFCPETFMSLMRLSRNGVQRAQRICGGVLRP